MSIEIGGSKVRPVDFTFNEKPLFMRKLTLRLALKIQSVDEGDSIPPEIVSEFISTCVVDADGKQVLTPEEVLEFDASAMMELFSEVSNQSITQEDAVKN